MNYLLDTQALLWFILDDPRLSLKAQKSITDGAGVIFISPASLWEIAIKISLGNIPCQPLLARSGKSRCWPTDLPCFPLPCRMQPG